MIFLIDIIQNLTTIGPVVSDITCPIKIDADTPDRQTDRQTETGDHFFLIYVEKTGKSSDGLDYYTFLAYAREVKSQYIPYLTNYNWSTVFRIRA